MKKIDLKTVLRVSIYLLGILVTALGIVFVLRSELGAGGWDAVNENLSRLIGITVGQASIGINITLLLFVIIYKRDLKYLVILFPILTMGLAVDLWNEIILVNFVVTKMIYRLITFVGGFLILPLGLGLILITKYPAMIFDELTLSLMHITKIDSFLIVRLGIEATAIILAIVFGLIGGFGLGSVSIGTLVISGAIGPLISIYVKNLEKVFNFDDKKIV